MTNEPREFFQNWDARMSKAKSQAPDIGRAFASLFANIMRDGALSIREKELIALGIGLADRCEPCIALHARKALQSGATREQILETAGVAVMMQGGPAYTYLPYLVEVLEAIESTPKSL